MRVLVLVATVASASAARAEDWQDRRGGLVLEASLGAGSVYHGPWGPLLSVLQSSSQVESFAAVAAAGSASAGGWLGPRVALTGHVAVAGFRSSHLAAFVGPDLQYWLPPLSGPLSDEPRIWLAGGVGVALARPYDVGVGIDARVGLALGDLQLSVEGTEGIFHGSDGNTVTISAVFLVGFQLL
jgi:hypothetical protein